MVQQFIVRDDFFVFIVVDGAHKLNSCGITVNYGTNDVASESLSVSLAVFWLQEDASDQVSRVDSLERGSVSLPICNLRFGTNDN